MSDDNDLKFSDASSRINLFENCAECNQIYSCSECHKTYLNKNSLRRHFRIQHPPPNEVDKLCESECYICSKTYKSKSGLDYHYLHNHKIKDIKIYKKRVTCPLCQQGVEKKNYFNHCGEVHEIDIETEEHRFSSFDDFKYWKEQIERSTNSKFSQETGGKADKYGIVKVPFQCHRSGYYVSRGKGIRHLKKQGSCKINGYCPAGFEVSKYNKDGKCHVIFTKTHIGHDNDIIHLQLSPYDREMIASKLASQIPLDDILDEIRDAVRNNHAERIHLLTRKDLYNIEQCYNLKYATGRNNKSEKNIESWIDKMYHAENSCILYYKPKDIVCDQFTSFSKEDFVLIIMNEAQCEILEKYNSDCVCIDNIYDSKCHNFHLVSLLVLDDTKQGFPCAFLISNRKDEHILSFFYDKVKFKCGNITPHVFMSDMQEFFYGSWLSVMDSPPIKRLYCSWHIDKAWRTNLKVIKCSDKQVETYKLLRALLEAKDCNAFENMLRHTLEKLLNDPKTSEFGRYFEEHFKSNASNWANCYNLELGFNLNLHVEGMHRSLEHLFLLGKRSFTLDKVIPAIMRFVRDKLAGRFTILYKCRLTEKLKVTEKRHKSIMYIKGPIIKVESGWLVETSSVPSEKHYIRDNVKNCNCGVICNECNTCLHRYVCSCIDNSVRWNMCQHIHYVCSSLSNELTDVM